MEYKVNSIKNLSREYIRDQILDFLKDDKNPSGREIVKKLVSEDDEFGFFSIFTELRYLVRKKKISKHSNYFHWYRIIPESKEE